MQDEKTIRAIDSTSRIVVTLFEEIQQDRTPESHVPQLNALFLTLDESQVPLNACEDASRKVTGYQRWTTREGIHLGWKRSYCDNTALPSCTPLRVVWVRASIKSRVLNQRREAVRSSNRLACRSGLLLCWCWYDWRGAIAVVDI